jgi:hypothetical protein
MTTLAKYQRRRIKRSPKSQARARKVAELDKLVGDHIKNQALGVCEKCGSARLLQSAHILSKGPYPRIRFEPYNLMALCGGCHVFWHQRPKEALLWFEIKWPGRYERLMIADRCAPKVDLQLLLTVWRHGVKPS